MDFRPFVIRAYLSSPVAGLGYLPIDGILLNLACQRAYGQLPTSLKPMQLPEFDPAVSPLQIIRYGDGDSDWIYQASFARWGDRALSQDFFTRRHNITEAEIFTSRKWETGRGEYRNVYHKFEQFMTISLSGWWWAMEKKSPICSKIARPLANIGTRGVGKC